MKDGAKRALLAGAGILLIVLSALMMAGVVHAAEPAESPTFRYYREIVVENNGNNLSNFQIMIKLDTNSLISAGKMNSNCSDIRVFTQDNSTSLPIWIDPYTINTNRTEVWVKVPSLPHGTSYLWLKYGNSSAVSVSNGTAVFDFFDDFSTDTTSDYSIEGGTLSFTNGVLDFNGGGSSYYAFMYNNYTLDNAVIGFDWYKVKTSYHQMQFLYRMSGVAQSNASEYYFGIAQNSDDTQQELIFQNRLNGTEHQALATKYLDTWIKDNAWNVATIYADGSNISYYVDGIKYIQYTDTNITSGHWGGRDKYEFKLDNVHISKIANPMPIVSVSTTENEATSVPAGSPDTVYTFTKVSSYGDIGAHQGVIAHGDYLWFIHTTWIKKVYKSNYTTIAETTNTAGRDHLGDGDYCNGKLYVVAENYSTSTSWGGMAVLVYNASSLQLLEVHPLDGTYEAAGVTVYENYAYIVSDHQKIDGNYQNDLRVYKVSMSDWTHTVIFLDLHQAVSSQGADIEGGYLFLQYPASWIYQYALNGTFVHKYNFTIPQGWIEGISLDPTNNKLYFVNAYSYDGPYYVDIYSISPQLDTPTNSNSSANDSNNTVNNTNNNDNSNGSSGFISQSQTAITPWNVVLMIVGIGMVAASRRRW